MFTAAMPTWGSLSRLIRLYAGKSMEGHLGIMWRDPQNQVRYAGRAPNFHAMNETPIPDFDEFYYARRASGYESWGPAAGCSCRLRLLGAAGGGKRTTARSAA